MRHLGVLALGVGNAFSAKHYSSSLLLSADERMLLIDCPHPIRKMLADASSTTGEVLDISDVLGVVLTHLHGDHASGLETFGYFCRYALGRKAEIISHPEVAAHLWTGHLAGAMEWSYSRDGCMRRGFTDYFTFTPLSARETIEFGPFAIQCHPTKHSVPTFAVKVTAARRTVAYSADTAYDPKLIRWLSDGADLIIHETGEHGLHTPYAKLTLLPPEVRSKMRLIHYDDDFDCQGSRIPVLRQGEWIML